MIIWLALLLAQAPAGGPVRGEEIFAKTCAVVYCHGTQAGESRAPQLAGRAFERAYVMRVTRDGILRTSMPGFEKLLRPEELQAVVDYVMRVGGGSPPAAASPPKAAERPVGNSRGKELFFDPGRAGSCGTCHRLDSWGTAIGPDVKPAAPADVAAVRSVPTRRVKTAHPAGEEPFPALAVEQGKELIRVYDLTALLPVLRTFAAGQVKLEDGSSTWSHAAATRIYSDEELRAILDYLRSR